jgi:hypothetical protein
VDLRRVDLARRSRPTGHRLSTYFSEQGCRNQHCPHHGRRHQSAGAGHRNEQHKANLSTIVFCYLYRIGRQRSLGGLCGPAGGHVPVCRRTRCAAASRVLAFSGRRSPEFRVGFCRDMHTLGFAAACMPPHSFCGIGAGIFGAKNSPLLSPIRNSRKSRLEPNRPSFRLFGFRFSNPLSTKSGAS